MREAQPSAVPLRELDGARERRIAQDRRQAFRRAVRLERARRPVAIDEVLAGCKAPSAPTSADIRDAAIRSPLPSASGSPTRRPGASHSPRNAAAGISAGRARGALARGCAMLHARTGPALRPDGECRNRRRRWPLATGGSPMFRRPRLRVIEQLYSNADGTRAVRRAARNAGPGRRPRLVGPHADARTHAGVTRTFTFPHDLPSAATAGRRVLVASQGFAALGLVAPDFVMPERLPRDRRRHARVRRRRPGRVRGIAGRRRTAIDRTGAAHAERRDELRGRHRVAAGAAGDRRRVPPRGPRPLLRQRPAAGHRRARQRPHRRLDAHRPRRSRCIRAASGGGGVNPVCRFYIPPAARRFALLLGVAGRVRDDRAEGGDRSQLQRLRARDRRARSSSRCPTPITGACPAGTAPVYRLWNQRADSNHRYTTSAAIKTQMLARGLRGRRLRTRRGARCARRPARRPEARRRRARRPTARWSATARARRSRATRDSRRRPTASTSVRAAAPAR